MDLGDGSVRSRSEGGEAVGKDIRLNEIGCGMNGPSDASPIENSGSADESVEFVASEKSADAEKIPGINGSCIDAIGRIVTSVEANGEIDRIEEAVATLSRGIGSPLGISKGLEDASFQSKSKEVEEVENLEKVVQFDETKLDSNTSGVHETRELDRNGDVHGKGIESPSKETGGDPGVSPQSKGYGLKRWRRIRRDHAKDGAGMVDPNRILKRRPPNAELVKDRGSSVENKQKSEASGSGSVASVNSALKDMGFSAFPVGVSDSEPRLASGKLFSIGMDSENSEDRSSKSTAASAPKFKPEASVVGRFTKEKNKVKNTKGPGNAASKAQQGKGKVEMSKKFRGERIEIEKENSHSSVESDLRSSNAVFTSGRQREGSSNYDGENSDEVQLCELQSSEEVHAEFYKENGEEAEVVSREDVAGCLSGLEKNKKSENQGPDTDQDPFAESVILLQAAQEVLEKEIQKLGEIGKETVSLPGSSSCDVSSSTQGHAEEMEESSSAPKEALIAKLSQKISILEHELELAAVTLKAKETKVSEFESTINTTQLLKERTKDNPTSLMVCKEKEMELEDLFTKKIEAEVKFLLMERHTHEVEDKVSLVGQLKALVKNQEQMVMKLKDAEDKAAILEKRAGELEASSKELLGAKDVLRMQNEVCKFTLCSLTQLILLCIAFAFFLLQLLPHSHGVVPT